VTDGSLLEFSTKNAERFFTSGPISLLTTFENTGSVHLNPYGEIRVTNILGEEVGMSIIDPWFVLPNALRTREIVWDRPFLFGRYTFTLSLNRGYDDIIDESQVVVWVIPWQVPVGIVTLLLLMIGVSLIRRR
jgi:hypothetical protein